ncbi:uncharacterized protein LOC129760282 [Uranotaenia lowii]|uniref:uncharacterized protein LOC129760282 n=1 Tax=Uranotaenia lowii TaxID=190385 RepID=UPI002478962B|nr:uncharacterized protein LOC129760282 [Uranotaenia lowii]
MENSGSKKRLFSQIAERFIVTSEGTSSKSRNGKEERLFSCAIDQFSGCLYTQRGPKCDIGNFIRHFRSVHPTEALEHHLFRDGDQPPEKVARTSKISVHLSKAEVLEACLKLVTKHNLPLACFGWEGMRMILSPLSDALGLEFDQVNVKFQVEAASREMKRGIMNEVRGKLVSLKIDSASRRSRHVLGVNIQYETSGQIVIRTIGVVEARQSQPAMILKEKIIDILKEFGITTDQIFTVTTDNGSNMIAAVKELQEDIESVTNSNNDEIFIEDAADEHCQCIVDSVVEEFRGQVEIIRCCVHTLQLAVTEVIEKNYHFIKEITTIIKDSRKTEYQFYFNKHEAQHPPLWCFTRWSGRYKMMKVVTKQEKFFRGLAEEFSELTFREDQWIFMHDFVNAFRHIHKLIKDMQRRHLGLSDFYILWIGAMVQVEQSKESNLFSGPLLKALNERLKNLMENEVVQAAIYLDPRLNFLGSHIFSASEKVHVQRYICKLLKKMQNLKPTSYSDKNLTTTMEIKTEKLLSVDDYITNRLASDSLMFGESATPFEVQLRQLDIEARQPSSYDVWSHWVARKSTYPELHEVAMVVLGTPSSQVSVERSFSALALYLSDIRMDLDTQTMENILMVKLNVDMLSKVKKILFSNV